VYDFTRHDRTDRRSTVRVVRPRPRRRGHPGARRPRTAAPLRPQGLRRRTPGRALHPPARARRARARADRRQRHRPVPADRQADARPLLRALEAPRRPDRAGGRLQPRRPGRPVRLRARPRPPRPPDDEAGADARGGVGGGRAARCCWRSGWLVAGPAARRQRGARPDGRRRHGRAGAHRAGGPPRGRAARARPALPALGLSGIAVYEDTIETLARKGAIVAMLGSEAARPGRRVGASCRRACRRRHRWSPS
jgi:hypothetical protein